MRPELLTLEVVPSGPGAGAELDRTVLQRLTRSGVRLSLDDFGRASSLARASGPPAQRGQDRCRASFAGSGRGGAGRRDRPQPPPLAARPRAETVAEGVETRAAWDALAALGCDRAQGFYVQAGPPGGQAGSEWLTHSWPAVALAG